MPFAIPSVFEICKQFADSVPKSGAGQFWLVIKATWHDYWLLILVGLIGWVIYEIVTRNGNAHYNSKNGFSPGFNRVVGSGTNALLQAITFFVLDGLFGPVVYCEPWSYLVHGLIFVLTKLLLLKIGFWVY